ncbi:MAG: DUF535 family protein [Marinicaulis sp.]|nr:DUF535 family protein [Marinicaulis sp.]
MRNEFFGKPEDVRGLMSTIIRSLWRASDAAYPEASWRANVQRIKLLIAGLHHWQPVQDVITAEKGTPLNRLCNERPETLGLLVWPYLNASWAAKTRLSKIIEHSRVITSLGLPVDFSVDQHVELATLDDVYQDGYLMLDQPLWFMREGLLTINLMVKELRAFSISFSFSYDDNGNPCAIIGGIQGRNTDDILSVYRTLTKSLYGMRPRDFLLETLKIMLRAFNIHRLFAVTDAARHHRHSYFNGSTNGLVPDYNKIWDDRGGAQLNADFFELDLSPQRRDFASIKPNKRSLYRKRFQYLDLLETRIKDGLENSCPVETRNFD